jgi:hypothetical protein
MADSCWDCKHNVLKMKVLVPHDQTIRECMHHTGNLLSAVVAVVKEKQGQYTVWFRSEEALKHVAFNMLHVCMFKVERAEEAECPCYDKNGAQNRISNIIYSKEPAPKILEAALTH